MYPVRCSSHKHRAEWHLYFISEERKASSPQSFLQVHLSYFGVRHKEIGFQWEGNTKRDPESHGWLNIDVRTLKPVCSSSSSVPGPGEVCRVRGRAEHHRRHCTPPAHTVCWSSPYFWGQRSAGGGGHALPGPAHSIPSAGHQGSAMCLETPDCHYRPDGRPPAPECHKEVG